MIFDRMGKTGDSYRFDELLSALYVTIGLMDLLREKMTLKTAELVSIYRNEEARAEKIRKENAPK